MKNLSLRNKIFIFILIVLLVVGLILAIVLGTSNSNDNETSTIAPGLVGKFIYSSGPGVTKDYEQDIIDALKSWDDIILDDHKIDVTFYAYSSNENTLAFAYMTDPDDIYSGGVVYINTYVKAETSMKNILEHEIGHVLGIGTSTKWEMSNNSDILDKNAFPNAYEFYKNWVSGSPNPKGIPLGSDGYHWSEDIFDTELMTPFSERKGVELPNSGLTLNALKDIGWNVDLQKADSFPPQT